ncbi:MAG: thioesterase family protein [Saprospiraceae bacterium]|nr:thioesterase family protein [Saprospiraceae bacterium]
MTNQPKLEDFPLISYDKIRYADTDRQGHVNNAVFSTFLETGRVEIFYNPEYPVKNRESNFVIASLKLDFLNEIAWPGQIDIGTGVLKIGNSSVVLFQMLFQHSICVAKAETVIVQVHSETKRSAPLSPAAREILRRWIFTG